MIDTDATPTAKTFSLVVATAKFLRDSRHNRAGENRVRLHDKRGEYDPSQH